MAAVGSPEGQGDRGTGREVTESTDGDRLAASGCLEGRASQRTVDGEVTRDVAAGGRDRELVGTRPLSVLLADEAQQGDGVGARRLGRGLDDGGGGRPFPWSAPRASGSAGGPAGAGRRSRPTAGHAAHTGPMDTITVYLLDDHEVVRTGLRQLLEAEPDITVVGESGSAAEAARRIPAIRPAVAVLDARLPDGSGIEVCREIRSRDPEIRALILTSYDDDDALFAAIMAGAAGYVLKDIRGSDLVRGIRTVAAGGSLLDPSVTGQVLERLRNGPKQDPRLTGLTGQERRILALIADGLSNRQIAGQMYLAEKTVKNYVSSLLAKLGMQSRTQAAVFAAKLDPEVTSGAEPTSSTRTDRGRDVGT